jgi:tRNA-2-methylthio-N6-dimethylallyladenosine synthase
MARRRTADFALLLELVAEVPGIERIRYTTSHPREFTQRLIDVPTPSLPKLVSHLHLPVQSGSDRILAAMKRGYTALEYKSIIRKLRAVRARTSAWRPISSSAFRARPRPISRPPCADRRLGFDHSFSFVYSPRPGTPAAGMADDTPQESSCSRLHRLQAQLDEQVKAYQRRHGRQRAARAGRRPLEERRQRTGRAHRQQPHRQLRRPPRLIGQFIDVTHHPGLPNSLRGEVIIRND